MEDLGWYVVDNLPPAMLGALVDEIAANDIDRLAVVLDVRSRIMFDTLGMAVNALDERAIDPAIVFLEASDETIVRRQESSRRPLPLQQGGHLLDAVALERRMLSEMKAAQPDILEAIRADREIKKPTEEKLASFLDGFAKSFAA